MSTVTSTEVIILYMHVRKDKNMTQKQIRKKKGRKKYTEACKHQTTFRTLNLILCRLFLLLLLFHFILSLFFIYMDSAGASQKQIERACLMLFWFAIFEAVLLLASWYYKPTCWPTSNKFVNFFLVWNCNHFLEYDHIIFFLHLFSSRFDSLLFPFTVGILHFMEKQSH